jgi:hypothetical protein
MLALGASIHAFFVFPWKRPSLVDGKGVDPRDKREDGDLERP